MKYSFSGKDRNKNNYSDRPGRTLVVNGVEWKWKVGYRGGVIAYSENGDRAFSEAWKIKKLGHPDLFFDGRDYDKSKDGMLTPGEVAAWLSTQPSS